MKLYIFILSAIFALIKMSNNIKNTREKDKEVKKYFKNSAITMKVKKSSKFVLLIT